MVVHGRKAYMRLSQPVKGAAPSLISVIITFGTRVWVTAKPHRPYPPRIIVALNQTPLAWLSPSRPPSLSLSLSLPCSPSSHCFRVGQIRSPFQGVALFILHPSQSGTEKERDTFNNQRARWKEQRTINSEWLGLSKTLNRQREGVCVCVCVKGLEAENGECHWFRIEQTSQLSMEFKWGET